MSRALAAFFDASLDLVSDASTRPVRRRIASATLQIAAVVGNQIQTYWDGDRKWFTGRIIEARVGE